MNIRIIYLVFVLSIGIVACQDDETYLDLSFTEIDMVAAGATERIKIETNAKMWQISGVTDWLSAERDSGDLIISAESNQTRIKREAKVVIVAGDQYARVLIMQEGSTRAVGEPYPDAENPIGIIYKVLDGGNHGKVISLDQTLGRWGKSSETNNPGARDSYYGLSNTRYMIDKNHEKATFSTEYYAFWWIHEIKNEGDLNGKWYIPAAFELKELYHILVGKKYTPTATPVANALRHDIYVRDAFDLALTTYGGDPFLYDYAYTPYYWSSTEYAGTTAYVESFMYNTVSVVRRTKTLDTHIRAVMEF